MMWSWWTLLTYTYNVVLVIFIATHLFVGALISFVAGLYIGIYVTQNYNIPRVTEPMGLWDKFVVFMEQHRLRKGTMRQLIHPRTIKAIIQEEREDENDRVVEASLLITNDEFMKKED